MRRIETNYSEKSTDLGHVNRICKYILYTERARANREGIVGELCVVDGGAM